MWQRHDITLHFVRAEGRTQPIDDERLEAAYTKQKYTMPREQLGTKMKTAWQGKTQNGGACGVRPRRLGPPRRGARPKSPAAPLPSPRHPATNPGGGGGGGACAQYSSPTKSRRPTRRQHAPHGRGGPRARQQKAALPTPTRTREREKLPPPRAPLNRARAAAVTRRPSRQRAKRRGRCSHSKAGKGTAPRLAQSSGLLRSSWRSGPGNPGRPRRWCRPAPSSPGRRP